MSEQDQGSEPRGTGAKKKRGWLRGARDENLADYSAIGMMFPASIAVGLAIGYFLDKWLNTSPYLLIAFTLYGVAAGFVNLMKITKPKKNGKKK